MTTPILAHAHLSSRPCQLAHEIATVCDDIFGQTLRLIVRALSWKSYPSLTSKTELLSMRAWEYAAPTHPSKPHCPLRADRTTSRGACCRFFPSGHSMWRISMQSKTRVTITQP